MKQLNIYRFQYFTTLKDQNFCIIFNIIHHLTWNNVLSEIPTKIQKLYIDMTYLKIPKSIGFLFSRKDQISTALVRSLILKCLETKISKITFYDPWNILSFYEHEIHCEVEKIFNVLKRKNGDNLYKDNYVKILIIGSKDVPSIWSSTTKELCTSDFPICQKRIEEQLEKNYIYEIDLLIKIGDIPSLCGYPCWVLNLAEIINIKHFKNKHFVSDSEFNNFLITFSKRDRRHGK
ncbi:Decaprenyl diphosphate synthase-like family-containing protein [Strongyloides ratti]|uniref:Decaprenyl diphosphate synthase-like family-containing protein n=1 Tax=Strongyloides ratti TaxID=34506 RepID=A0A090LGS1_STRRB|nr:Decaprenyl diphosphate synthase-like family-containing protein [Strongyloides ratti]CEF67318.1 Decaprenyl diphosphate synthase-like family-containing protein [Strongyloides ratti]